MVADPLGTGDAGEQDTEQTVEDRSKDAGAGITKRIAGLFATVGKIIMGVLAGLTRPIPLLGTKLWKSVTMSGLKHYHKAAGGDRVGLEVRPNGMELTPVKWRGPSQTTMEEKPGWKAKGRDKVWKDATDDAGLRLGKVPVIPLDSESWRAHSTYEARLAEAVDQGKTREVYDVSEAELYAEVDMSGANGAGAVADGGVDVQFRPRDSPVFQDTIIELGGDDFDGQVVSWDKAKELAVERTATEEMAQQEERGFLAGRSKQDMKSFVWKVLLVAGGIALGGLVGPELIAALFGGGGGGASIVPV